MTKFKRQDANLETTTKVIVAPNDPVEIRSLEIKNNGNLEETLEVTVFFEPVLSYANQDYAHIAFNNLFLTFEELENDKILIKRRKRGVDEKDLYMCASLYTEDEAISDMEYEIDKEKFVGKRKYFYS
jgi:cellobiose phosphorylase